VAFFLTIASYVFPSVFEYTSIPQFTGKPLQVFVQYLNYLSEYNQKVSAELSELSEQIETQSAEIAVLFAQNYLITSELNELSECCSNLSENLIITTSEIIDTIDKVTATLAEIILQLIKRDLSLIKYLGMLTNQLAQNIANGINESEYDQLLSQIAVSYWNLASETVIDVSELLGATASEYSLLNYLSSEVIISTSETTLGLIEILEQLLNALLGLVNDILSSVLNSVSQLL